MKFDMYYIEEDTAKTLDGLTPAEKSQLNSNFEEIYSITVHEMEKVNQWYC